MKVIRWALITMGIVVLVLVITCPTEDEYYDWLSEKYSVSCEETINRKECHFGDEEIVWRSRHTRTALIFIQIEEKYTYLSETYETRVTGLLNTFIDHSSDAMNNLNKSKK